MTNSDQTLTQNSILTQRLAFKDLLLVGAVMVAFYALTQSPFWFLAGLAFGVPIGFFLFNLIEERVNQLGNALMGNKQPKRPLQENKE